MDINIKGAEKKAVVEPKEEAPMTLKLLRHWTPSPDEDVIVLGWKKPAVMARLATGGTQEIEPARFVGGEMAPAPVPGADNVSWSEVPVSKGSKTMKLETYTKIWAGTYIEVAADTAYTLIEQGAAQLQRAN